MSDWLLLAVEPCRLAREMEVCRDMDAVSFIVVDGGGGKKGRWSLSSREVDYLSKWRVIEMFESIRTESLPIDDVICADKFGADIRWRPRASPNSFECVGPRGAAH